MENSVTFPYHPLTCLIVSKQKCYFLPLLLSASTSRACLAGKQLISQYPLLPAKNHGNNWDIVQWTRLPGTDIFVYVPVLSLSIFTTNVKSPARTNTVCPWLKRLHFIYFIKAMVCLWFRALPIRGPAGPIPLPSLLPCNSHFLTLRRLCNASFWESAKKEKPDTYVKYRCWYFVGVRKSTTASISLLSSLKIAYDY